MTDAATADIPHVIQLATAPVFLLTAVGATLSVLASRLARVVDRGGASLLTEGSSAPVLPCLLQEKQH